MSALFGFGVAIAAVVGFVGYCYVKCVDEIEDERAAFELER